MDSMIWNWYVRPVDFAMSLPFFAFDLSPDAASFSFSFASSASAARCISACTSSYRSKS